MTIPCSVPDSSRLERPLQDGTMLNLTGETRVDYFHFLCEKCGKPVDVLLGKDGSVPAIAASCRQCEGRASEPGRRSVWPGPLRRSRTRCARPPSVLFRRYPGSLSPPAAARQGARANSWWFHGERAQRRRAAAGGLPAGRTGRPPLGVAVASRVHDTRARRRLDRRSCRAAGCERYPWDTTLSLTAAGTRRLV